MDSTASVTQAPQVNASFMEGFCPYKCDTSRYIHENNLFTVYNIWVVWRHLMTALIPIFASKGMDIKYVWDDFKKEMWFKHTQDNKENLTQLIKFTDKIHPKLSNTAVPNLLMLVVSVATWILGGQTRNF